MAVYTKLTAEAFSDLIDDYDVGDLISFKGIAEGVSNSNWLVETTGRSGNGSEHYILTMYESRVEISDLPFFLGLLDHLAAKGSPVPRTIHDRSGATYRIVDGKAVALIEFLSGVSVDAPTPQQGRAVGEALAGMHLNSADFAGNRANTMGLPAWRDLFAQCGRAGLASIDNSLPDIASDELEFLAASWPLGLPSSVIHADLFPDNVLLLGNRVSGLIDFYFACRDITAYDFAVTHAAWSFSSEGIFQPDVARALAEGYCAIRPLNPQERAALPVLARGATLRFMATRAFDWLHTPADALVTRKDPMDFARRLDFYKAQGKSAFPGWRVDERPMKRVELFTDGACKGNPGPGGWGALLRLGRHEKELSGGEPDTTNNRMEMTAVIRGLQALIEPCEVIIHSDSRYVIDGMTRWIHGWQAKGWINASRKPVRNADLWHDLIEASERHRIEWVWVKGHSGHVENERVDRLASDAADEIAAA